MAQPTDARDRSSEVRDLLTAATHQLLGDTISVSDEDWRAPSRLPGWTRGHVATHLARQADALSRLVSWARTGERTPMYDSDDQRDGEIEAGADRGGLDLQIDLDTTAGRLDEGFDALAAENRWDVPVELRGGLQVSARLLPLARLGEVVLHHVDLDIGFGVDDIDPTTAGWLLEYCAYRLGRDGFPSLELRPEDGAVTHVGPASDDPTVVGGGSAQLLGWLTGRGGPEAVSGADALSLPPF